MSEVVQTFNLEGLKVWVPDRAELWVPGTIIRLSKDGESYEVNAETAQGIEKRTIHFDQSDLKGTEGILQMNALPAGGVEDMCALIHLHQPAVLANLRRRFQLGLPYTYAGNVMIAVNPYRHASIYKEEVAEKYSCLSEASKLPPHLFAISAKAFRGLSESGRDQSILISGESGAGKTEAASLMLNHLTLRSRGERSAAAPQAVSAHPLLESFGNAQTLRNDNSSRFGSFTSLQFDPDRSLAGAHVRAYLLEKSRVTKRSAGERNFHIFYELLAAPEDTRMSLGLGLAAGQFGYLCSGSVADPFIYSRRFEATDQRLKTVGMDLAERTWLWGAVAAVLLLGELEFKLAVIEDHYGSVLSAPFGLLDTAAANLGVDSEALCKALTSRTLATRSELIEVPLGPAQARETRDSLAKESYRRLFDWLVSRMNAATTSNICGGRIGLLDMFGFECIEQNGFEQLCINYADEKLQFKFADQILRAIQVDYTKEGIAWEPVEFSDNGTILDLIESNRFSILSILDEECMLPKGTEEQFVQKLSKEHKNSAAYKRTTTSVSGLEFTVSHFAGDVTYCADGWITQNRDVIHTELLLLLQGSTNPIVSAAFGTEMGSPRDDIGPASPGKRRGKLVQGSLARKFTAQLGELMREIDATQVQYVRCIKPNGEKSPSVFDNTTVLAQLKRSGVVESIRIARATFPFRLTFAEFHDRFYFLAQSILGLPLSTRRPPSAADCRAVVDLLRRHTDAPLDKTNVTVGRTAVFLRRPAQESLEKLRGECLRRHGALVHAALASHAARRQFARDRRRCMVVQALWRARVAKRTSLRLARERGERRERVKRDIMNVLEEKLKMYEKEGKWTRGSPVEERVLTGLELEVEDTRHCHVQLRSEEEGYLTVGDEMSDYVPGSPETPPPAYVGSSGQASKFDEMGESFPAKLRIDSEWQQPSHRRGIDSSGESAHVQIHDGLSPRMAPACSPTSRQNSFLKVNRSLVHTLMQRDLRLFITTPVLKEAGTVKCVVKRHRGNLQKLGQGGETYSVFVEGEAGDHFLMNAVRKSRIISKSNHFSISMWRGEFGSDKSGHIGRVYSTSPNEYRVFDDGYDEKNDCKSTHHKEVCGVTFSLAEPEYGTMGSDGPLQMQAVLRKPNAARRSKKVRTKPLLGRMRDGELSGKYVSLKNRVPRWNAKLEAYVLNFNGRVTHPSVKNFQLVESGDPHEKIKLQFGRMAKDGFTMDFSHPLTPLQAFGIALTSFVAK